MSFTAVEPTTLHRERLDCDRSPHEVLGALRGQPWPFALTGRWAGGGAIVGSAPLVVADPGSDPFATLDALPPLGGRYPEGAVGGGWFGWLGYRLGRRIERIRPGPPRPVPLPEFHLAYYDHVLRLDADGQWWFEALVSPGRLEALERRRDELERAFSRDVAGAAYEPPPPFLLRRADRTHHLRAVQDCRRRIAAGEIFQANVCLRLESRWPGEPTELYSQAIRCLEPDYGAAFRTPWGGVASLSPELFLR